MRRISAVIGAFAIVVPLSLVSVGGSASAARATTLSVSLSQPMASEKFTLSGRTATSFARTVQLQYLSGKKWKTARTAKSSKSGYVNFAMNVKGRTSFRLNVPKTKYKKKTHGTKKSPVRTVYIAPQRGRLTLPTGPIDQLPVAAAATFSPVRKGRVVTFQEYRQGTWVNLAARPQDAKGVATLAYSPTGVVTEPQLRAVTKAFNGAVATATSSTIINLANALPHMETSVFQDQRIIDGHSSVADQPSISGDGNLIAFTASFPKPDGSSTTQIYVRDISARTTTLASHNPAGQPASSHAADPRISSDGRFVVYDTVSGNLIEGHTEGNRKVVLYDVKTDTNQLISTPSLGDYEVLAGANADISGDGSRVVFQATIRVNPSLQDAQVLIVDRKTGDVTPLSADEAGAAKISTDGRYVAYENYDSIVEDRNVDVHRFDLESGTDELVSRNAEGGLADDDSNDPSISNDGRLVSFASVAKDIVSPQKLHGIEVYVRDMVSGTTRRVSVYDDNARNPWELRTNTQAISSDGSTIAYTDWVGGDIPLVLKTFNLRTGQTRIIKDDLRRQVGSGGTFGPLSLSSNGAFLSYNAERHTYRDRVGAFPVG